MKRAVAMLGASVLSMGLGSGCIKPDGADAARNALPAAASIQIRVPVSKTAQLAPTSANEQGLGSLSAAAAAKTAEFYALTRNVSDTLNGGAAFVLILVHTIVEYPVTSIDGTTFIWGPWTDALKPSEYRLTVSETAAGDFDWALEGRLKADGPTAPFTKSVFGTATPGAVPGQGKGHFHLDFDESHRLDPVGSKDLGQLEVAYDLEGAPATIAMEFAKPVDQPGGGMAIETFNYSYAVNADGSGDFQYTVHSDIDHKADGLLEDLAVRSRWQPTGAGRSDISITGGDVGAIVVTGSECWDTSFDRVYWSDTIGIEPAEGDAGLCAFDSALLPGQ